MKTGPKHFVALENIPCFKDNEITRGFHTLTKGYQYETTNAQYLSNGDLYFELWDDDGYIGFYVVNKAYFDFIQEIVFA